MPAPRQVDIAELTRKVRELVEYARRGGAPDSLRYATASEIVDALLELQDHRAGYRDPRRQRTLALAKNVAYWRAAGASIAELMKRFDRSDSQIYRLLRVAKDHATKRRYADYI